MSKFFPISWFKWIDQKEFHLKKYASSKGCALEVDVEYPKELQEMQNDYPLAPDKTAILSDYQLKTGDLYNIVIGNVKK